MSVIEEIKVNKNKETQRFLCEVLQREKGRLILRFRSQEEGRIRDIAVRKGSTTIGYYWADKGYILWRIFDPEGSLTGTLFHICKDVTMTEHTVSYLDLILDIWVSPEGDLRIFDEDELEDAKKADLIDKDESHWIEEQKKIVLENYAVIINGLGLGTENGKK